MDLARLKSLAEGKLHEVALHFGLHFVGRADDDLQTAETALGTVQKELKSANVSHKAVDHALSAALIAVSTARTKTQALESAVRNAKF